jgi:hypothetical protein
MVSEDLGLLDFGIHESILLTIGVIHFADLPTAGDYPLVDDQEYGLPFVHFEGSF